MIARDRAIATARDAGFDITVENVSVSASGITLHDVTAKAIHAPGVTAKMTEAQILGLGAKKDLRLLGLEAKLDGERTDSECSGCKCWPRTTARNSPERQEHRVTSRL